MLIVIAILLVPLVFTFGKAVIFLIPNFNISDPLQLGFLIAFVVSFLIFLWKLKPNSFFATFEHELTHNIWAFFTLQKMKSFSVKSNGEGSVEFEGRGNFMITLSPYFFPTFNVILLPFRDLLKPGFINTYLIIFGVAFAYHFVTSIKESHTGQSDIKRNGYLFSYILIIFGNILFTGICFSFVQNGWSGILDYLTQSIQIFIDFFESIIEKTKS